MSDKIPTPEEMAQKCRYIVEDFVDYVGREEADKEVAMKLTEWRDAIRRECVRAYLDFCISSGHNFHPLCADKIEHVGEED